VGIQENWSRAAPGVGRRGQSTDRYSTRQGHHYFRQGMSHYWKLVHTVPGVLLTPDVRLPLREERRDLLRRLPEPRGRVTTRPNRSALWPLPELVPRENWDPAYFHRCAPDAHDRLSAMRARPLHYSASPPAGAVGERARVSSTRGAGVSTARSSTTSSGPPEHGANPPWVKSARRRRRPKVCVGQTYNETRRVASI